MPTTPSWLDLAAAFKRVLMRRGKNSRPSGAWNSPKNSSPGSARSLRTSEHQALNSAATLAPVVRGPSTTHPK